MPLHLPSYCQVSRGGYTRGVSGPVGVGIRELELIINPKRIHGDYAKFGHAAKSWHHCGLAADILWEWWVWNLLWPARKHLRSLLGPPGLYEYGVRYYNASEYANHSGVNAHIHVSMNLTTDEVDHYLKVPRRKHLPPNKPLAPPPGETGDSAPSKPVNTEHIKDGWHDVMHALGRGIPAASKNLANARRDLTDALK